MTSLDDFNDQSHTGPGIEDEPRPLQSSVPPLGRTKPPVSQATKSIKSKRSTRPAIVQEQMTNPRQTLTPVERFRLLVRKVMHLNAASRYLSGKEPGAEPGVDVRRDSTFLDYGHIRKSCLIEIVDYSSIRSSSTRMTNREFISFLTNPTASERERWVKVRWINVGGVSWDVVRALALKYGASDATSHHPTMFMIRRADLHPLSLEGLLHVPGGPRSGADYYKKHLFIRVLSHTLNKDGDEEPSLLEQVVRSFSPEPFELEDEVGAPPKYSVDDTPRSSRLPSKLSSRLKLPRRSGTIGHEKDGFKYVDMTNTPIYMDYGSFYATYVRLLP